MAQFVFKLAGVLKQRLHEEQQRQRELAERQAHLSELQLSLQQLNERVQAASEEVRINHLVGTLNLGFLAAHRRYLGAMQRGGIEIMQRMVIAQKQADEALALLAEAAKRRKAMEKLRDKQFERWRAEQDRKETMELDEIAMQMTYHDQAQELEGGSR